jgi:hypothetical protein
MGGKNKKEGNTSRKRGNDMSTKAEKEQPKGVKAQPKGEKAQSKEEKTQPKYKKDQKVRITLGKNLTNPEYRNLIKHDSQHGTIIDEGFVPEKGKNTNFPGEYLYRIRIGTNKVSDVPEQMLEADKSAAPTRPDLE